MPNTKRLRRIRKRLWDQDKRCHYCKEETVWWVKEGKEKMPPNAATLDHIISRLNPVRHTLPYYPSSLIVLACNKCNNERGAREDITLRSKVNWESRVQLKSILLTDLDLMVNSSP
jgi:5-methylcytosine-specific restriction endonuclease McrA